MSPTPRYLTKSRFKLALECPTKLYYTGKPEYLDRSADVSGGQEPHLFGGEGAAAVCGFGMACAGAVLSTSFS